MESQTQTQTHASAAEEMIFFSRDVVRAKLDEGGGPLLETPRYRVDAIRRARAGDVVRHLHYADVIHVVEGTATIEVGGRVIHDREVAPGELRTHTMEGGKRHDVGEGDVLVIREGVPHQFVKVSKPFLYIAVRIETGSADPG
jgi:quercetin dioxygenase-like cupin family protein